MMTDKSLKILLLVLLVMSSEISVFSHHASIFRIDKNRIAPVLLARSVTLSVLSVTWNLKSLYICLHGHRALLFVLSFLCLIHLCRGPSLPSQTPSFISPFKPSSIQLNTLACRYRHADSG